MTADRFSLAADDPRVVVGTEGLLAEFNDAGVIAPIEVTAAQVICRLLDEADESVALAAALTVRGTNFGHVCIRLESIREAVVVDGVEPDDIEGLPWPDPRSWLAAVASSPIVGDGTGDRPLVLSQDRLYLERYFRYEQSVAASLVSRLDERAEYSPLSASRRSVLDVLLGSEDSAQRRAAELALTGRFTVIAGGPGTGKTHTVGAILGALASDGRDTFPQVALCAPTGKAAARLGEAVGHAVAGLDPERRSLVSTLEPATIHRLLGWRRERGRFAHDRERRLPHDLVIVDEMSMVSLPMAAKLLAAIRDDASLVMVGDPYQLESIEAGTVLTDIVAARDDVPDAAIVERIVVLDRVHRFAPTGPVAGFAESVRSGDADAALDLLAAGHDQLRWVYDRSSPEFEGLWEGLIAARSDAVRHASRPADPEAALASLNRVAVLCARRRGPESVAVWGREIESTLDQRFVGLRYGGEWYPGRPVMITANDYRLELFNGDIGVAVETDDGMAAIFEREGMRSYPLARLGEHSTVHAMTIHKSQGSQFAEVIVVLPDESSRLLTRELLYTAVTRSTTTVSVVGGEEVLRRAIGRSVERASGLSSRLR